MRKRRVLGILAVAGPALLTLSLALVIFFMVRSGQAVTARLVATHESVMAGSAVMSRLADAEADERAYLLTGDQEYLAGYWSARADIGREITRLRRASADDAEQQFRISQAEALVARRLESSDRQVQLQRTPSFSTARADMLGSAENALSDSARTLVDNVLAVESQKRRSLIAAEQLQARITIVTVLVGSVLALLLSLVINAILVRSAAAAMASAQALRSSNSRLDQQAEELVVQTENLEEQMVLLRSQEDELQTRAELLHRNQEMMASILDGMSEAVIACDAQGVLTYFNPAAQKLSPVPAGPRPPSRWGERYAMLHRETKTPLTLAEAPLYRALQGEVVRNAELILAPPGSSPCYMIAHASPLRSTDGTSTGAVVILHDVTEILNAEAALRASDEKLRQAQKMEAIGALAGGIAHDFNNLLTAITSFGEFALEGTPAESDPHSDIVEILKASDRAASLTQQLLAFSRRQMMQPRNLDLSEVVRSTEKLLRRVLGADIEIELKNQPELGVVLADPVQIEQVILNLAINSRHAMPAGGRLIIETGNLHLDEAATRQIAGTRTGKYVVLTVSDTGLGMDAVTRQRAFEPFFTTKERGKGTGLGLSSVYGIVQQSGGAITVYSEPGLGTTFRIYLPQTEAEASPLKSAPTPESTEGSETILVAEDQEAVRTAIRRILIARGYVVLEATNGVEALALAEKHEGPIHLLIADMVMPKMGGVELCRMVTSKRPDIGMLLMSGYSETVTSSVVPERARFVEKPFKIDAFVAVVRSVLDEQLAA